MMLYWRRLPHFDATGRNVFLTWRLHGSLPPHRAFPSEALNSAQAFETMDRLLEEVRTGPFHLRQTAIADAVVEAIHYRVDQLGHYELHAFVVMPNHVHILIRPFVPLAILTKSLKSFTAKQANAILGRSGVPFWQAESYDHQIRDSSELAGTKLYIEHNPVRARLARTASEYRWSSAWERARKTACTGLI